MLEQIEDVPEREWETGDQSTVVVDDGWGAPPPRRLSVPDIEDSLEPVQHERNMEEINDFSMVFGIWCH